MVPLTTTSTSEGRSTEKALEAVGEKRSPGASLRADFSITTPSTSLAVWNVVTACSTSPTCIRILSSGIS
jgi:hypothetical protein